MEYRDLKLDRFQEAAIRHLMKGSSVLVAAPTGTGKTIIADWIVEEALRTGRQVIYTAPIKALSNQKFRDYTRLHGEEKVGLVTGDLVIRRDAPCLVMTTEILRNILLGGDEPLEDLLAVILDEVHFLDDRERGTVWEEVLIYLPPHVQVVGLSATLPNLADLAAWMQEVRGGRVEVIEEPTRLVPLTFHCASIDTGGLVTPERFGRVSKQKRAGAEPARRGGRNRRGPRGRPPRRGRPPQRTRHFHLIEMLRDQDLLPCLYFSFSRRDTELFARDLGRRLGGEPLLDKDDRERLATRLDQAARELGPALDPELRKLYARGIAFHHAGLHVQLKALVEELYELKLVRVLYCTSTFALGINMPARTVAFEGLRKYDGREVRPLSTREFMQKAGRAGRRGMDEVGHVVVRADPDDHEEITALLSRYRKGAYEPVHSSFNLSWNSVVNLLARHDEDRIREIISKSFLSWHLARETERGLARAEAIDADPAASGRDRKEARRLRRRAARAGDRVWQDFQQKVNYLQDIGYLDESLGFNAGAKVLRHLQIAEVAVTELVLSGLLEPLDMPTLFGTLCGLTNELPRSVTRNYVLRRDDRKLAALVESVVMSGTVVGANEITASPMVWDPGLVPLGRAWAEGRPLQEILLLIHSGTDVSGDLITGFRRAKDLAGQLLDVYAEDPHRVEALRKLIRDVSRDEVEVVD